MNMQTEIQLMTQDFQPRNCPTIIGTISKTQWKMDC